MFQAEGTGCAEPLRPAGMRRALGPQEGAVPGLTGGPPQQGAGARTLCRGAWASGSLPQFPSAATRHGASDNKPALATGLAQETTVSGRAVSLAPLPGS